jgi:hypothetical protein
MVRVLATILVLLVGLGALLASVRWIALDTGGRWSKAHRLAHARIDQRLVFPTAIFVDTIYAALGTATGANVDYWVSVAILLVAQVILIVAILAAVRQRKGGRT